MKQQTGRSGGETVGLTDFASNGTANAERKEKEGSGLPYQEEQAAVYA